MPITLTPDIVLGDIPPLSIMCAVNTLWVLLSNNPPPGKPTQKS